MHFSYAVVAALVAGQAYASTVNVLPRQTPDELLKMIPEACASTCQPLTSLQTECGAAGSSQQQMLQCVCKADNVKAMEDCTACAVKELTASASGAGVDPATIQAGIDAAQQTFRDLCKDAGAAIGGSSTGGSTTGGSSSGTTTAATSGSTGTTGSSASTGNGNSGVRVEFAGSAILAAAGLVGALLL